MNFIEIKELLDRLSGMLPPRLVESGIKLARSIPFVNRRLQREYASLLTELEETVKPYKDNCPSYQELPQQGASRSAIIKEMTRLKNLEEAKWREGYVSGAVYHGDAQHISFLNKVYALHSQVNPLHSDIWPSALKYEAEIVAMTAEMLSAKTVAPEGNGTSSGVCGGVTSGGTESILLAMKTYRDYARARRGIKRPEMIVPLTAHAAFDKAAQYFKIAIKRIPTDDQYRADVRAAKRAISRNTIAIVGSAPTFPHGVVDPITELSALAHQRGIGFHTDACLGGFVLPWAEQLGYPVPPFDFRLPGVTSISVDTHKYGYAAKGTSVVLYRNPELRRFQFYKTTEWPGGLYFSPTFAGSRPGALSAACWAAMLSMGKQGYLEATRKLLATGALIKQQLGQIPELYILGDPLWDIAFGSRELDIYQVMDFMTKRNWSLNGLHKPPSVHLCLTLRHTQPGVAERFIADLKQAVDHVRQCPNPSGGLAPIYGIAASMPDRGLVGDILEAYMDMLYRA